MKPPPQNSILVFAGPADTDERNLHALLDNWLPKDLPIAAPILPADIPAGHRGLRKVRAWLKAFPENDPYDEVDDLAATLAELTPEETARTILVVLWQDGDEETEMLVNDAEQRGIQVLSLGDGLDTLMLGDRKPPEEAPPARRTRRARPRQEDTPPAEAPASTRGAAAAQEPAPREPDAGQEKAPDLRPVRTLAYVIARSFLAAADILTEFAENTGLAEDSPQAAAQETQFLEHARTRPRAANATRAWFKDPGKDKDDPAAYVLRGRGQPRRPYKDWPVFDLTEEREKELGLPART